MNPMQITEFLYNHYKKYPYITTDTRKIEKNCIFFALKGERFDGNEFADEAIEKGAAYVVIDNPKYSKNKRYIAVNNSLSTLQNLARYHRCFLKVPVIGITGTNGKTTTKELIAAVMKKKYKIHSTIGNLNNHIGVPLTLLSAPFDTEILIIEMGANHIGEIATLCTIANPNYGIITNIGKAHLEGFGSLKGVIKAKTELYKYLSKNNGCVFYNEDNNILNEIVKKLKVNKVSYGSSKNASYPGRLISASPFLEFAIKLNVNNELSIKTKLIGGYNYENAMAAAAIGQFFHVPIEDIKETIENYEPVNNRSQLVEKDSNIILCDYYNANPTSMEKALINFAQLDSKGKKKILIIGEMKELGKDSKFEHQNIIKLIDDLGFENVLIIGNEYHNFCHPPYMFFDNNDKCKEFLLTNKITNSIVLIKGSRGAKLEEIFEIL